MKKPPIFQLLIVAVCIALIYLPGKQQPAGPDIPIAEPQAMTFEKQPVTLETKEKKIELQAEMALTQEQQSYGLMFRKTLEPDTAMLFPFEEDIVITMWMQNTFIPLDMVFFDRTGKVVHIVENTVPESTDIISSEVPAAAVLELAAGKVKEYGLQKGDRIIHTFFKQD